MILKYCRKCDIEKSVSEFSKNRRQKDGLGAHCKSCYNEYHKQHKAKILQRKKDIYSKEAKQEYYKLNKDRIKETNRKRYLNNKAHVVEINTRWRNKNPIRAKGMWAKRRARLKDQSPKLDRMEKSMIDALYWMSKVLSNSCGEQFHVDHIHPIARGGLHIFDNLQILSAEENLKKGASFAI